MGSRFWFRMLCITRCSARPITWCDLNLATNCSTCSANACFGNLDNLSSLQIPLYPNLNQKFKQLKEPSQFKDGASASVCFGHARKRVGAHDEKTGFLLRVFTGSGWIFIGYGRVTDGFPKTRVSPFYGSYGSCPGVYEGFTVFLWVPAFSPLQIPYYKFGSNKIMGCYI